MGTRWCGKMEPMTEAPHTTESSSGPAAPDAGRTRPGTVVVVGPDGRPVGTVAADTDSDGEDPSRLIEQPAKVMRIGSMIKQLLEEVRAHMPLGNTGRIDLAQWGAEYARAFREFGIDVEALPAAEAAERIRSRTISAELVAALVA